MILRDICDLCKLGQFDHINQMIALTGITISRAQMYHHFEKCQHFLGTSTVGFLWKVTVWNLFELVWNLFGTCLKQVTVNNHLAW